MSSKLAAERWNAAYRSGRYDSDPPIPFVGTIMHELGEEGKSLKGLYVGCGNGRNYIPLLESGYRVHGADISKVAIEQLLERYPAAKDLVATYDFANIKAARVFDYVVAIQVFQHGNKKMVENLFHNVQMALKPGGKFFLRTNSVSTELEYAHEVIEGNDKIGKTILYKEGPKEGMFIHFYSEPELLEIANKNDFGIILPAYEITTPRKPPHKGTWTQWEAIWQKK